jgi:hypothetical protein
MAAKSPGEVRYKVGPRLHQLVRRYLKLYSWVGPTMHPLQEKPLHPVPVTATENPFG